MVRSLLQTRGQCIRLASTASPATILQRLGIYEIALLKAALLHSLPFHMLPLLDSVLQWQILNNHRPPRRRMASHVRHAAVSALPRVFRPTRLLMQPVEPCVRPSNTPIHPSLVSDLRQYVQQVPEGTWQPLSQLYSKLSVESRRQHVRPHRTFLHVLQRLQGDLGIQVNTSTMEYVKGTPKTNGMPSNRDTQKEVLFAEATQSPVRQVTVVGAVKKVPPPSDPPFFTADEVPPVDFYYDVGLTRIPDPPPDFDVTPSSLKAAKPSEDGAIISLASFVTHIPPFFAPMSEVLEHMPGYTEEHWESYFDTKAVEVVRVAGQRFIRLYGGYAKISLDGCEEAENTFARYKPDPSIAPAFVNVFGNMVDKWMPLPLLLERASPEAVAKLPMQGPAAIIYFAQMQHVFAFSVDRMGGSVLLRRPGYGGLECETTPTPKSCNCLLRLVPIEGTVDVQIIQAQLSSSVKDEMQTYFGGLMPFIRAHAPVFSLSEDDLLVMRTRYRRRVYMASLPLEEQLQLAIDNKDKRRIRTIRRRIAFRNDPSHPFHDPDNLAREVSKYLPRRGFVTLKSFLKKNIPEELLNYMPNKMYNFFAHYPQYFSQFEYQKAGQWCLTRPGQPLPRGVIRQEFSEEDLVRLIAAQLQQRGSRSCTNLHLHLPRGAQDTIKKRHGGVYYMVEKYPQYFGLVLASDQNNVESSAMVHLIQAPTAYFASHEDTDFGGCEGSGGLARNDFANASDDNNEESEDTHTIGR